MKPLVSVVIPAYNKAKYIQNTIDSILSSEYDNIELVVVDNCSVDNTVEILKGIDDPRFRYVVNPVNLGMVDNWNKAVREAKGEYVKLVPGDDILYANNISASLKYLTRHPDIHLVITGIHLIDDNGKVKGKYPTWPRSGVFEGKKLARPSEMITSFYGNPVCALFRKKDFEKVGGFDKDFPYIPDLDLWLALSSLGKVAVVRKPSCAFRLSDDSNTGNALSEKRKIYTKEHMTLFKKYNDNGFIPMNAFQMRLAVLSRNIRNLVYGIYERLINR